MKNSWLRFPFINWAHRGGAWPDADLETRQAYEAAAAAPAAPDTVNGIECDIRTTRDWQLVVHHDPRVGRRRVGQLTLATLSSELGRAPVMLTDLLDAYPDMPLTVELKRSRRVGRLAAQAIMSRSDANREMVIVTSRWPWTLRAFQRNAPGIGTAPGDLGLAWFWLRSLFRVPSAHSEHVALQPPERRGPLQIVTRRFMRTAERCGLAVHTWTVNDASTARRHIGLGVHGIFTDDPALLTSVRFEDAP